MTGMWRRETRRRALGGPIVGAFVVLLGSGAFAPAALGAQESAEAEVLAVVTTLFDGMREKDEAALRSVFHADARLHTASAPDEGTPIEGFLRSVLSGPAHLDEVTFDERVLVDGALAVAWTPYNFFADGQFSHCGVNAFTMVRTDEGWKILQIVDTRIREGCDPSRRG